MDKVLVLGAGKIGRLIAVLLANSNSYKIYLADIHVDNETLKNIVEKSSHIELIKLDVQDENALNRFFKKNPIDVVISSLPYYCNISVIKAAKEFNLNYFDLTEDTETANAAAVLSKDVTSAFVPQCGLAPGFISIVTNNLMQNFSNLDTIKMRVGALPLNISNGLQYSLTWSTDGLINEYGNLCQAIQNRQEVKLPPLDGLEEIKIDGLTYEAFNTSGGIGTLVNSYREKVNDLTYKTIRYPGHCEKMRFLMNDLNLNNDRETLKRILENSLPKTLQDVVLVYVSVTGTQENQFREENYVKKFYPKKINGFYWSAIQLTTASALCAIMDIVMSDKGKYKGLVRQEQFSLESLTTNRFGEYYA